MKWSYIAWSTGFAVVGTFVFAIAVGLIYSLFVPGDNLPVTGRADFTWFDLILYGGYALLVGSLVGWRSPAAGGLHAVVIAFFYVLIFFNKYILLQPVYPVVVLVLASLSGLLAWRFKLKHGKTV